jgi:hypothetical protein
MARTLMAGPVYPRSRNTHAFRHIRFVPWRFFWTSASTARAEGLVVLASKNFHNRRHRRLGLI